MALKKKYEIRAQAENCVQVEDDPDIIDAEVDGGIQLLEKCNFFDNALIYDEYDTEDIITINLSVLVPSF